MLLRSTAIADVKEAWSLKREARATLQEQGESPTGLLGATNRHGRSAPLPRSRTRKRWLRVARYVKVPAALTGPGIGLGTIASAAPETSDDDADGDAAGPHELMQVGDRRSTDRRALARDVPHEESAESRVGDRGHHCGDGEDQRKVAEILNRQFSHKHQQRNRERPAARELPESQRPCETEARASLRNQRPQARQSTYHCTAKNSRARPPERRVNAARPRLEWMRRHVLDVPASLFDERLDIIAGEPTDMRRIAVAICRVPKRPPQNEVSQEQHVASIGN